MRVSGQACGVLLSLSRPGSGGCVFCDLLPLSAGVSGEASRAGDSKATCGVGMWRTGQG